jgi:hypothetical protein
VTGDITDTVRVQRAADGASIIYHLAGRLYHPSTPVELFFNTVKISIVASTLRGLGNYSTHVRSRASSSRSCIAARQVYLASQGEGIASPVDMWVWIRWCTSMIRLQLVFSYALLYTIRKSGFQGAAVPWRDVGNPA